MPAIPVIIQRFGGGISNPSAPGWLVQYGTPVQPDPAALVCHPLAGGLVAWGSSPSLVNDGTISPSTAPTFDFGNYQQATITVPDDAEYFPRAYYTPDSSSYTYFAGRFGVLAGVIGSNMEVSVDDPLSPDAVVTLTVEIFNFDELINDALFFRSFDRVELTAGGVVYTKLYADMTVGDDSTGVFTAWTNVDTSALDTLSVRQYSLIATFEFPLSAQDVSIRIGTPYDTWRNPIPLKWVPAGSFDASIDDDVATLDARGVYVVGGDIRTGDGLRYTFTGGLPTPLETDEKLTTYDVSPAGLNDGQAIGITLLATSQAGCTATFFEEPVAEDSNTISGMSDNDGVGYETVKSGANLLTYQYPADYASRVLKSTLENHDNPTLYQIEGSSRFFLAARNRATDTYTTYYSDDNCVNFGVLE